MDQFSFVLVPEESYLHSQLVSRANFRANSLVFFLLLLVSILLIGYFVWSFKSVPFGDIPLSDNLDVDVKVREAREQLKVIFGCKNLTPFSNHLRSIHCKLLED